jgi:hypothetical protein
VDFQTTEYFNECLYGKGHGSGFAYKTGVLRRTLLGSYKPAKPPSITETPQTALDKAKDLSRRLLQSRGVGETGLRADKLRGVSDLHQVLVGVALSLRDEREDPRPVVQFDVVMSVLVTALGVARSTLYGQLKLLSDFKLIAFCGVAQEVGESTRYTNTTVYVTLSDLYEPKLCRHEFKRTRRNMVREITNKTTYKDLRGQIEQLGLCEDKEELVNYLVRYAKEHTLEIFTHRITSCSFYDLGSSATAYTIEAWAKQLREKLKDKNGNLKSYLKLGWKLKKAISRGWNFLENVNTCLSDALINRIPAAAFWTSLTRSSYWEELWNRP